MKNSHKVVILSLFWSVLTILIYFTLSKGLSLGIALFMYIGTSKVVGYYADRLDKE